jgi:hypothetical protein
LLETAPDSNVLSKGGVMLPAPVWNVVQPAPPLPGQPAAAPVVAARIEAPEPINQAQFGEAIWVKVFTTELPDPIELEDLVADNQKVKGAVTEVEWQLLQKDPGNANSGVLEKGYGVPIGPAAASILRRYEFFKFSGMYKAIDHEATFADGYGDSNPLIVLDGGGNIVGGDVGTYLGAQNAAVNLAVAAVPEVETYAMLLAGLGLRSCAVGAPRRLALRH